MSKRKKLPRAVERSLLSEARGGCFVHRITWARRVLQDEEASKKALPLDIHHVVFVSAGGDDSPSNLMPLCPLCHRFIHHDGRLGNIDATPENLRVEWDRWRSFAALQIGRQVGDVGPHVELNVDLPTYALRPRFLIAKEVAYSRARLAVLEATLLTLADSDPHFAFASPRGPVGFGHWSLSCDEQAQTPWDEVLAHEVLVDVKSAVTLTAPQLMLLNRTRHPVLEGSEEQRTL